jgi:hypothetical protein
VSPERHVRLYYGVHTGDKLAPLGPALKTNIGHLGWTPWFGAGLIANQRTFCSQSEAGNSFGSSGS